MLFLEKNISFTFYRFKENHSFLGRFYSKMHRYFQKKFHGYGASSPFLSPFMFSFSPSLDHFHFLYMSISLRFPILCYIYLQHFSSPDSQNSDKALRTEQTCFGVPQFRHFAQFYCQYLCCLFDSLQQKNLPLIIFPKGVIMWISYSSNS